MHIMEGYLPPLHALAWTVAAVPFVLRGARKVAKLMEERRETRLLLAASGAFAFMLSALKLPSVTGSCSHPTGVGLGAILFGPSVTTVLGSIVLVFQALLLAHGGLTTLGANVFSMAVAGPWVSFAVFRGMAALGAPQAAGVFFAAMLGDLATYCVTACQLALAFPDPASGFGGALTKFMAIYAALCRHHMKHYGTTQRHLAAVSAKNHGHSVHNPYSQFRKAFTIEEILAAPPITYPLTLPMCAPLSDGAAAAILCTEAGLRRIGPRTSLLDQRQGQHPPRRSTVTTARCRVSKLRSRMVFSRDR